MSIMSAVMEAYAGRSKELIQCEKYMKEIVDTVMDEYHSGILGPNLTSKRKINRSAAVCKKLESTLEKFFNVKEIKIYWDAGTINAYTLTGMSTIIAVRNSKGDFSHAKFNINLYENLIYHAGLNEKEMMAVLLHEIGHCFYSSPFLVAGELLAVVLCPPAILVLFLSTGLYKTKHAINDFIKTNFPVLKNFLNKFQNLKTEINNITRYTVVIPNLKAVVINMTNNIANPFAMFGRYGAERGADSFAAKYGYGEYLISALRKLETPENTVGGQLVKNTGAIGGFMKDYNNLMCDLFVMIQLDPHPSNDVRAQSTIRKLERDLKTGDYPPELEKELRNEINRTKQIYSTLHDNGSNVKMKQAWYNMLNVVTHGHNDIREILNVFYEKYEF